MVGDGLPSARRQDQGDTMASSSSSTKATPCRLNQLTKATPHDDQGDTVSGDRTVREPSAAPSRDETQADDEFPTGRSGDSSYTDTVLAWAARRGVTPPHTPMVARYHFAIRVIADELGPDHPSWVRLTLDVVNDFVARLRGQRLQPTAVGHLHNLVIGYGPTGVLDAVREALDYGAGLDPDHAKDDRALSKYAASVIRNKAAALAGGPV